MILTRNDTRKGAERRGTVISGNAERSAESRGTDAVLNRIEARNDAERIQPGQIVPKAPTPPVGGLGSQPRQAERKILTAHQMARCGSMLAIVDRWGSRVPELAEFGAALRSRLNGDGPADSRLFLLGMIAAETMMGLDREGQALRNALEREFSATTGNQKP